MWLIHEDGTDKGLLQNDPEESVSNYGGSVGWVTDSKAPAHGWDSDSSTDYLVMSIRRKQEEELKRAEQKWRYELMVGQLKPGSIAVRQFLSLL